MSTSKLIFTRNWLRSNGSSILLSHSSFRSRYPREFHSSLHALNDKNLSAMTPPSQQYAIATTDTAFKHLLSLTQGSDKNIVISFLHSFIPGLFTLDPIHDVKEASVAVPALRRPGDKQTFMDLHVVSSTGVHYLIEMQAQRHVKFDERALFYAASTFSRQLSEKELGSETWYLQLKPVIALQILDYDTNRIRGHKGSVPDELVKRARDDPLPPGSFTKHYILTDRTSGQVIDYLQMVQVELPRAIEGRELFPPQEHFREIDWWVSVLKHADCYTAAVVEKWRTRMPEAIYNALKRLDLTTWNPREIKEYQEDITRRDIYAEVLAVERVEGREEGKIEGREEGKIEGREEGKIEGREEGKIEARKNSFRNAAKLIQAKKMERQLAIELFELGEAEVVALDAMLSEGEGVVL